MKQSASRLSSARRNSAWGTEGIRTMLTASRRSSSRIIHGRQASRARSAWRRTSCSRGFMWLLQLLVEDLDIARKFADARQEFVDAVMKLLPAFVGLADGLLELLLSAAL